MDIRKISANPLAGYYGPTGPTRRTQAEEAHAAALAPDQFSATPDNEAQSLLRQTHQQLQQEWNAAAQQFQQAQQSQGLLGTAWDGLKNTVGVSGKTQRSWLNPVKWWSKVFDADAGSHAVQKQLLGLKQNVMQLGEASDSGNVKAAAVLFKRLTGQNFQPQAVEQLLQQPGGLLGQHGLLQTISTYHDSQKTGADVAADLASGLVAFTGYSLAVAGALAAPFTLGSSLALTAWGVGIATVGGAASKTVLKAADAFSGGRAYDSLGYDLLTGGFSGLLAPVSAGVGALGAKQVGTQLVKRLGLEGLEVGLESTARTLGGQSLQSMATQMSLKGGSTLARGAIRSSEWVISGVAAGALDNPFRHVVQTGSLEGTGQAFIDGVVGGAVLSPLMGGGMHLAGKGVRFMATKAAQHGPLALHPTLLPSVHAEQLTRTPQQVQHLANHVDQGMQLVKQRKYQEALAHFGNADAAQQAGYQLQVVENALPTPTQVGELPAFIQQAGEAHYFNPETSTIGLQRSKLDMTAMEPNMARRLQRTEAYMAMEEWLHALQESAGGVPLSQKALQAVESIGQKELRELDIASLLAERKLKIPGWMAQHYNRQAFLRGDYQPTAQVGAQTFKTITVNGKRCKFTTAEPGTVYHATQKSIEDKSYIFRKSPIDKLKAPLMEALQDRARRARMMKCFQKQVEADPRLAEALKKRGSDFYGLLYNDAFKQGDNTYRTKKAIEKGGVSFGKICQIFADDPTIPAHLRAKMADAKSKGLPTRTLGQAQQLTNQLYGRGIYQLESTLAVGTVGETWLAKTASGEPRVIKILKKGVSKERLEEERLIWKAFVHTVHEDDFALRDRTLLTLDRLFDGWMTELDFNIEKAGLDKLSAHAKRYTVAPAEAVGRNLDGDGISIAYHMAPGLGLDNLSDMLKVYQANPAEYAQKFADKIQQHPWLANPQEWRKQLPHGYLASQNEQTMFLRTSKGRTSHGDPHSGNVFVTVEQGKVKWTYIDTGLTVTRTSRETIQHMGMFTHMILGNTEALAKRIIDNAEYLPLDFQNQPISTPQLTQKLNETLKKRVYQSGIDCSDLDMINRVINNTLDEFGIVQKAQDTIFLKSQLQSAQTYAELCKLTEQPNHMLQNSLVDVGYGLMYAMTKQPIATRTPFGVLAYASQPDFCAEQYKKIHGFTKIS